MDEFWGDTNILGFPGGSVSKESTCHVEDLGAAMTKDHKFGGLKLQKCIVSQFLCLEGQNQGIGRPMLLPKALSRESSWLFLASSSCWESLVVCLGFQLHHSSLHLCWPLVSLSA